MSIHLPKDSSEFSPDPRLKKTYYLHVTTTRKIITVIAAGIYKIISDIDVSGLNNLPSTGPVILAANHITNYDVFAMQLVLPRPIFFMGKEELFRNPILERVLRKLGGIPVYRGAQDEWAMQHAEEVLFTGGVLGIFPEGTRNKGIGLRPAKTGAARLALLTDCPIIPLTIHGTQFMFRDFPRRTKVEIKIGPLIEMEVTDSALSLTDRLMFRLADMLPPESRGAYRYRPPGF
jgi:1-acyl-sn-glycerol-3-phosphate acyltransferase